MAVTKETIVFLNILCVIVLTYSCPPMCNSCTNGMANCLRSGLRDIPKNFPTDTVSLDLSGNQLTELNQESFQDLPNLQSLTIPGNGISTIGERTFQNFPLLSRLDLSGNPLSTIHDDAFIGLVNLRMLSLTNDRLKSLGSPFKELPALSNLNLGFNQLQQIDADDFENNRQVRILDLSNNRIASIHPEAFKNLRMLRYLILTNNQLSSPVSVEFSSNVLQLVDFTKCQLTKVPKNMPASVRDFRLGNNEITEINDDSFTGMTNLRLLILNNNMIKNVTYRAFRNLLNLKELWLTHNQMFYVPLGLPTNLEKFYMDHNDVYEVGTKLFSPDSMIKVLSFEMNKITSIIPNAFKDLINLETLNFQINELSDIKSGTFSNLPSLKTLQLSNNPLQIIESNGFQNLPNLTSLSMSYIRSNDVALSMDFLEGISNINNLQFMNSPGLVKSLLALMAKPRSPRMPRVMTINLEYNELKTLPRNMMKILESVQRVFLDGNPFHCDKTLLWLKRWMARSNIEFFTREPLKCVTPPNVQDQEITNLSENKFAEVASEIQVEELDIPITGTVRKGGSNTLRDVLNAGQATPSTIGPVTIPASKVAGKKLRKKGRKGKKRKGKKNKRSKNKKRKNKKKKGRRPKRRISRKKRRCRTLPDGTRKCRRRKPRKLKNKKIAIQSMAAI